MLQADSVWTQLAATIADLTGHPADRLLPDTVLAQVPGWDSFTNLQFIGALEEDFGVTIPVQDAMKLRTLNDVQRFIMQSRPAGATQDTAAKITK